MTASRLTALILMTSVAVSCRTATPSAPQIARAERTTPVALSDPGDGVPKFTIPSLDFSLLPTKFKQDVLERSMPIDGVPPTYTKAGIHPAIIQSTGIFALMSADSILTRKWKPPARNEVLDVVPSKYISYINSNAYLLGIDPSALGFPIPRDSVIHEIPADMPIRQQSPPRLTCMVHAAIAAMEIRSDVPNDLSEQYAQHVVLQDLSPPVSCCDDAETFVLDDARDLEQIGLPLESAFPYTADFPACTGRLGQPCLEDHEHPKTLPVFFPNYRITIGEIPEGWTDATIRNVGYLEAILESDFDIVIEVGIGWLNDKVKDPKNPDNIIQVLHDSNDPTHPMYPVGYHGMLLTGYDRTRHFFIARNSMGAGWGLHNGEAWLSYDYIATYAVAGFIVTKVEEKTH
jgi:hypothetical protein